MLNFVKAIRDLDPAAADQFGPLDLLAFVTSMRACGMADYPNVTGSPEGERCSGEMQCEKCNQTYYRHPMDWRIIGHGDVPFLNILCDGRRVKL